MNDHEKLERIRELTVPTKVDAWRIMEILNIEPDRECATAVTSAVADAEWGSLGYNVVIQGKPWPLCGFLSYDEAINLATRERARGSSVRVVEVGLREAIGKR